MPRTTGRSGMSGVKVTVVLHLDRRSEKRSLKSLLKLLW
jgi:hypothetical protein